MATSTPGDGDAVPLDSEPGNFLEPAIWANPHPWFAELRASDPVSWNPWWKGWLITRFDDVGQLLRRQPEVSAETVGPAIARATPEQRMARESMFRVLGSWMMLTDPPDHTRLRRLVNKAFTPSTVARLQPGIERTVTALLDAAAEHRQIDIVRDFSRPLTLAVISEMLGIPHQDRDQVAQWADDILPLVLEGRTSAGRREQAETAMADMERYFRDLVQRRREQPGEDLITALADAEDQGNLLTSDEVVATCIMLIFAGQETTTGFIANSVLALHDNPGQRDLLQRRPETAGAAVEELLRFCGTAFAITRLARVGFELRGKQIAAGDKLMLVLAAANRDPQRFPDPDRLDLTRDTTGHVAFAGGVHYCLGGPLARVETRIGLCALLARFPDLQVAEQDLQWRPVIVGREPTAVMVDLGPERRWQQAG
jgi:cytochrome P450